MAQLRVLLAIATEEERKIYHLDTQLAYLNTFSHKLVNSMSESGDEWFNLLAAKLDSLGFRHSDINEAIYVRTTKMGGDDFGII